MDFDIPDAPPGETYQQEIERCRPHIPGGLRPLWESLITHETAPEDGWPEMVANFLQLKKDRIQACLGTMAMIHLARLGGSMLKLQSSTIAVAIARGDGIPFLASAYAAAKMAAVIGSADLRRNDVMLPTVSRLMTLISEAEAAQAQLAADAVKLQGSTHARHLSEQAKKLRDAIAAVRGDLAATGPAPAPASSSSAGWRCVVSTVDEPRAQANALSRSADPSDIDEAYADAELSLRAFLKQTGDADPGRAIRRVGRPVREEKP